MNLESLIEFVKASSLDAEVKEVLADRLQVEGLTTDTVDVLKEAFQDKIDELFDAAGVKLDANDPETKKMFQEYEEDLAQIQKEGEVELASLQSGLKNDVTVLNATVDQAHTDQIRKDFP